MATYYVATDGSDSNPGTEGSPWRTLQEAWDTMQAGDTTYVRGGTYNTSSDRGFNLRRSGSSNNRITMRNYPGEIPIFDGGDTTTRWLTWGGYAWNEIIGLTIQNFDAEGIYSNSSGAIGNRIIDCDFNYFNHNSSSWRSNSSIVCNIRQGNWVVSGCNFIYCKHNCIALNGAAATVQYCTFQYGKPEATLFSAGNSNGVIIEYCNFLDLIEPWGGDTHVDYIQWWGGGNHNWIVRNNYFRTHCYKVNSGDGGYNNACIQTDGSNDNLQVYNNVVYHNSTMGVDTCAYAFNVKLGNNVDTFNNTIYGARSYGIRYQNVDSGSVYNNIVLNSGNGISINSGISNGNNYTSGDARFVSISQENFRLQSDSPCINAGNNNPSGITLPSYDKDGNDRIMNGTVDRGAYEYGSGPPPTATTGVTYYVATTGSDSNSGTATDDAWLTPAKAFATAVTGDTVNYRAGTYNIATTLNTVNAGTPDGRIIHRAYPGETPVFNRITDGSKDIITIWHPYTTISGINFTNGVDNTEYSNMIHTVRVQVGGSYALLTDLNITSPGHTIFGIQASGSDSSRLDGITARNITVSAMGMYESGANWNTGLKLRYCDNSLVQDVEIGPQVYGIGTNIEQCTNITVSGMWIHDIRGISNGSYNCFGMEIDSCTNVTCSGVGIYRPNNSGNVVAALWLDDDHSQNENINFYNCQFWSGLNYDTVSLRRVVGSRFYNCVFASSTSYGIDNETGGSNCVIKNSIFYECTTNGSIYSGSNNFFDGVASASWSSTSTGNGDAGMVDPGIAATEQADWDLAATSICIDCGVTHASDSYVPELDYKWNARTGTPDVGPHEYGAAAPTGGTAVPSVPQNLGATAVGNAASLSWDASTNSPTAYNVYIATAADGLYSLLGTTANTSYYHNNLPTGAIRFYKVSASNEYGTSDYSNIAMITIGSTGRIEEFDALVSYGGVGGSATTSTYEEDDAAMTYAGIGGGTTGSFEENSANISYHAGATGGATTAAVTGIDPVDILPGGTTGWYTIDASSHVGASCTGVIVKVRVGGSSSPDIGIRHPDSTSGPWDSESNRHYTLYCGVNGSMEFEFYRDTTDIAAAYLTGYFNGPDVIFFDDPIDITPSATGDAWTDADITAHTTNGTAKVALLQLDNSYTYDRVGIRKNGSTDDRQHDLFRFGGCAAMGVDGSEILEISRETSSVTVSLIGYIKDTDTTVIFPDNATDVSLSTAAAWTDLSALPTDSVFGFFEFIHTGANYADIRKNGYTGGASFGTACDTHRKTFQAVECDGSQLVEGIVESISVDFFRNGYVTAGTASSSGDWYTVTGASYSSGSANNSYTEDDYAEIAFTGTGFTLYSIIGPSMGRAQLKIDGTLITDGDVALSGDGGGDQSGVELYNSSWLYQQSVYTKTGLSDTAHTATIICPYEKHASSSDYTVQIDKISYTGSSGTANYWYTVTGSYSAGQAYNTGTAGDYVDIAFTGNSFSLYSMKAPTFGYMQILIDGTPITDGDVQLTGDTGDDKSGIDCYDSGWLYQQNIYNKNGLSEAAHTATLKCTDQKHASATEYLIQADRFEFTGTAGGTANSWYFVTGGNYSAASAKNTLTTGDYAEISFTGTAFTLAGGKGPNFGYAQIKVDGSLITDGDVQLAEDSGSDMSGIDLWASNYLYQQPIYSASGLANEGHTVRITCYGAHSPNSSEDYVQLDYLEYMSGATGGQTATTARPTDLAVSANDAGNPVLTWMVPSTTGVQGYYVYRSASATSGYVELDYISSSATTAYEDTNGHPYDQVLYYKVCAYTTEGAVGLPALNATTGITTLDIHEDNTIISNSSYTASNLGITPFIGVGTSTTGSDNRRALLKTELPDLGTGTHVVTAYLLVYTLTRAASNTMNMKAYRMSEYWFEGAKDWEPSTQGDSNWVYAVYTTEPWLTAGVYNAVASASDCATTGGDTINVVGDTTNTWYGIDIRDIVQEWIDESYTNYGVLLKDINEDAITYTTFASVQHSDENVRPNIPLYYQTPYVDITLLSPPTNLYATVPTGTDQVNLTWDASTGNALGYYVERSTALTGSYSEIGQTSTTAYNDTSTTAGSSFYYRVRAYNDSVTSSYSNTAAATLAFADFTEPFDRADQTDWGNNWIFVGGGITGAVQLEEGHIERQVGSDTRAFVYQSNPDYKYRDVEIKWKWKNYSTTANRDIRAVARHNGATAVSETSCFAGGYQKTTPDGDTGGSLWLQYYGDAEEVATTAIGVNIDDVNYWYYGKFKCEQESTTATTLGIVLWREDETEPTAYTGASALTANATTAITESLQNVDGYCGFTSYFRSQHIHFDDIIFKSLINQYYVALNAVATGVATIGSLTGSKTYSRTLSAIATAVPVIAKGTAPNPPTSVDAAITEGTYYVDISWVAPAGGYPYDIYNVYRKESVGGSYTKVGSCASAILTFRDQSPMETDLGYDYIVRSATGSLESVDSNSSSVTTNPDAPDTLSITATSTHNQLGWDASDDNITGYQIDRSQNGIQWALLATTGTNSYYDESIETGKTYYYRVRTEDTGGAG